jgi:serine/threonine protein phosphatase PrpC
VANDKRPESFLQSAPSSDVGDPNSPFATGDSRTQPGSIRLLLAGKTDVGMIREHNEDNFLIVRLDDGSRDPDLLREHAVGPRGTLLVVCDGMGGAAAGEIASAMAVESVADSMLTLGLVAPPDGAIDDAKTALGRKLRGAAEEANQRIFREARENSTRSGMGTTMTAVMVQGGHAVIAQVGDSRAYLWRKGAFTQVTRDQSLVNQLLETGQLTLEQSKFFEYSNVILQALGVQEEVEVQLSEFALRKRDRLLLCSDGLVGVIPDEEIGAVLGAAESPHDAVQLLVAMANDAGGPDNVTVVAAFIEGEEVPVPGVGEVVEYRLWRIDPEPRVAAPPIRVEAHELVPEVVQPALDQAPLTDPASDPGLPSRAGRGRLSLALVLGLLLGSLAIGMAVYRPSVPCSIRARPGFRLLTDGRDSGMRTVEGSTSVRLPPGHHRISLAGKGAPTESYDLEVSRDRACVLVLDTDLAPALEW